VSEATLGCAASLAPDGYDALAADVIGAVGLYALWGRARHAQGAPGVDATWFDAQDWRADELAVYRDPSTGAVLAGWAFEFASEATAAEFARDMADHSVVSSGAEVRVLVGEQAEAVENWASAMGAACP